MISSDIMASEKKNNIQYGENNHIEYTWSNIQQENILQLSFQMVRTNNLVQRQEIVNRFMNCFRTGSIDDKKLMIKLLVHTRDIECGKGEYAISISIIKELIEDDVYREVGVNIMCVFVGFDNKFEAPHTTTTDTTDTTDTPATKSNSSEDNVKPYGSWKDMKYLFNELGYCPTELINIINDQIAIDLDNMKKGNPCSLVSKWVPREKSNKFGWIHECLAKSYFPEFGQNTSYGWTKSAVYKAQTYFRKLVSSLNKYIDTIQIKQCGRIWKFIDFDKVTSVTMMKQRLAFLNNNKKEGVNKNKDKDRDICRQKLLYYMEQVKNGKGEIKGKNISMSDFVKAAIHLQSGENEEHERFIINEAWKNNSKYTKRLENMIAIIDTSNSMENNNSNPLFSAMGLGIRIAEKSRLGKRIMTFDTNPTWINLEECKDFVDEVKLVRNAGWGRNTDFHKAMNMILDQIRSNKIPAEDVEDLVLVVFSDMQFDAEETDKANKEDKAAKADKADKADKTIISIISQKFHDVGIEVCGRGYKMPHILFWNLQSTNGFPELSYQNNVTMLSGYSPSLFNSFIQDGMNGIKDISPWRMLTNILNSKRYNKLEDLINE